MSSLQEPCVYHGKLRTTAEGLTPIDIILSVSTVTVYAITVHQNKMVFQSPIGVLKEIVWDHSEKSVHFVLDDGSISPTFDFPVLTELETHFTAILALPDFEKPPEQVYIGVLIGQNLPSPIQQRRASLGFSQPAMIPMSKRRELLRREQPVRNAVSRERLGLEYIRSGYLCFTCSINGDLRGLTLGVHQLRVFPSPDCHDRSACLFSYSYEHLGSCEVEGTRLELRFRTTRQLAKQPSCLVFQSLESQYIREAIWYLKNGSYIDASLREMLSSPTWTPRSSDAGSPRRGNVLMFFTDADNLKQRIDACCRVIGCENLVECSDQSDIRPDETSGSNVMINYGELSHMNPNVRANPSTSRVLTNGLCEFHVSCLSSSPSGALTRQKSMLSRDKPPLPAKTMQSLISLLQSTHYAKMFKFQGQLLKRQNGRTFHLKKTWHPKFVVLFETPVGGFLCYYDRISHCPGMTDTPKERRVIDLSSVLCIRPVSNANPVSRGNSANTPTMHAFDVVTLYRTWTFAAVEPEEYEVWLHVLTECVEKHATIAPDRVLRFPVKLAMTAQTSPTEATSLEISSHGVSFCTGHDAEVVLSSWYYTDLEKWSVVFQQGYTCCLLKCRSPAPASPGSPRTIVGDTITQDYLFRTTEASTVCLAIEFYVGKCMAKLEVLAGQYMEETQAQETKTTLVADRVTAKRGASKLQLQLVREHPIENVSLAPVGSPERPTTPTVESPTKTISIAPQEQEIVIAKMGEITNVGTDAFIPPISPSENVKDLSLVDLEDPLHEIIQVTQMDHTSSYTAAIDEKKQASFQNEIETLQVGTSKPPTTLKDEINGQREVDNRPGESKVMLVSRSSEFDNSSTNEDDVGEFESIDLGEADSTTNVNDASESSEAGITDVPVEPHNEKQCSTPLPEVLLTEEVSVVQTSSSVDDEIAVSQNGQVSASPAYTDTGAAEFVPAPDTDVFMELFPADIATQETCSNGICVSTTDRSTPESCSTEPIQERNDPQPGSSVSSSTPLLLLEYIPSWPGEPQCESVAKDAIEYPTPSTGQDEAAEDDRTSECEVSDQSDAFNSCASEADPVASYDFQLSTDCSDEVFQDAIDLELNEELPSIGDRIDTDTSS